MGLKQNRQEVEAEDYKDLKNWYISPKDCDEGQWETPHEVIDVDKHRFITLKRVNFRE